MINKDAVSNDRSPASWARVLALLLAATNVLQATPQFALVAQNKLTWDESDFNGTPAIAGRQLFLRSNRNLYCIEAVQTAGAAKAQ